MKEEEEEEEEEVKKEEESEHLKNENVPVMEGFNKSSAYPPSRQIGLCCWCVMMHRVQFSEKELIYCSQSSM